MEQGNPEPARRSSLARDLNDQAEHEPPSKVARETLHEPRDAHRFIADRVRAAPVTVTTLTRELYGVPSAAWAAPWRSRVISAVNSMAAHGRLAWVTLDGEPAATLPAAALGDPQEGAESAQEAISGPPVPPPVRGPLVTRQRRIRRDVQDVPLPS